MKLLLENYKPRYLISRCKHFGDSLFTSPFNDKDYEYLPKFDNYEYSINSAILLTDLVYVEPHKDGSVGNLETHLSIFSLLSGGKNMKLLLKHKDSWKTFNMNVGDWVVFNDRIEHMVLAETKWSGIAIQVKEI